MSRLKTFPRHFRSTLNPARMQVIWLGLAAVLLVSACIVQASAGRLSYLGGALGEDDAWISYRYARNLAAGEGLVFNPGEQVEGYSNFLYVMMLAPAFLFLEGTSRHIYTVSTAINVACACAALWIFAREIESRLGRLAGACSAFVFALMPAWWVWIASGLETPLVVLLHLGVWSAARHLGERAGRSESAGAVSRQRTLLAACLLAALSALARPDGFIFPFLAAAWLALRKRRRDAALLAGTAAAVVAAHTAFRLLYYGDLLPNTFHAKVDGALLQRFHAAGTLLVEMFSHHWLWPLLLALAAIASAASWPGLLSGERRARVGLDAMLTTGWTAYWFYIGGDFMGERFLLPLIFIWMAPWLQIAAWLPRPAWAVVAAALVMIAIQGRLVTADPRFDYTLRRDDPWSELGRFLASRHRDPVLAIDAAGKVPYLTGWRTIDMLGLTDRVIARRPAGPFVSGHSKYDADEVLSRRPDLIAAWVANDNLDLMFGLDRGRYERAGYRVRYLQRVDAHLGPPLVLDVPGQPEHQIIRAVREGYVYGVLERLPSGHPRG